MHAKSAIASLRLIALSMVLVSLGALPVRVYAQAEGPTAVVEAWINARVDHDVERAVALLDDNAFLIFTDFPDEGITVYEGKAEIRQVLQSYEGADFRITVTETPNLINGTVTWAEAQSSVGIQMLGVSSLEFFGEALVEGGKIRSLIYGLTPEGKEALAAADYPVGNTAVPGMPRSGVGILEVYQWLLAMSVVSTLLGLLTKFMIRWRACEGNER